MRGANYGWPNVEGRAAIRPSRTRSTPIPTTGATRRLRGLRLSRHPIPSTYQGSYFFADYAQNTIKRLTFGANGNVNGGVQFRAGQRSPRRTHRGHRHLTERRRSTACRPWRCGHHGQIGVSKIRRISFVGANQPPVAQASANPTTGPRQVNSPAPAPPIPRATVTYAWNFGDNTTSTLANPTHTYTTPGPITGSRYPTA